MKRYSAISYKSPNPLAKKQMSEIGSLMATKGYELVTPQALTSMDFIQGASANKGKIHIPTDRNFDKWVSAELKELFPASMKASNVGSWSKDVRESLTLLMRMVLGDYGNTPTDAHIIWIPTKDYFFKGTEGVGWATRCAIRHNIPVYNTYLESDLKLIFNLP